MGKKQIFNGKKISDKVVLDGILNGPQLDGNRLFSIKVAEDNGLPIKIASYIRVCIDKNIEVIGHISETIGRYCELAKEANLSEKETLDFIILFLNQGVCPPKIELESKLKEYKEKGYSLRQILSLPEIFRDDTPEETKELLIILLKKAKIKPTLENLAYYTRMGLTKNPEQFRRKVGICLYVGNTAKDILDNYRVLTESVPLDIFYGVVVAELHLIDKDYSKLPKSDSDIKLDLGAMVKKVYEENKNIKDGKMLFIPVNKRFVLVPIEKMRIESKTKCYMEMAKIK